MVKSNKTRVQITLSNENLDRLEAVYLKYGVSKSTQINSLIIKHLKEEFGDFEKELLKIKRKEENI